MRVKGTSHSTPPPLGRTNALRLTTRSPSGNLRDGFLTSFVNPSRIQPISDLSAYGTILDEWLTVLSRLSLHARHVKIYGRLKVWRRREVEGITLRYDHAGLPLGDIVLLWNADDPSFMAVDPGTARERLAWVRSRRPWLEVIHGRYCGLASPATLDAVRTATLLLGYGITPAARGAGSVTRRVIEAIPGPVTAFGLGRAVREWHGFWNRVAWLPVSWPLVGQQLEGAVCWSGLGERR